MTHQLSPGILEKIGQSFFAYFHDSNVLNHENRCWLLTHANQDSFTPLYQADAIGHKGNFNRWLEQMRATLTPQQLHQ